MEATLTYNDHQPLIKNICARFRRRYGGFFDDLFSEAQEIYLNASENYDSEKSTFKTWVTSKIWWGLLSLEREKRKVNLVQINETIETPNEPFLNRISEDLTKDAKEVMKLCLDTPKEVMIVINGRGGYPSQYKVALQSYLRGNGWTLKRITSTFDEIKTAL